MKRLLLTVAAIAAAFAGAYAQSPTNIFPDTGRVGIKTVAPTHSLTFGSASTGIALYNTADQTGAYERLRQYWSGNVFNVAAEAGTGGSVRNIAFSAGTRKFNINNTTSVQGFFQFNTNTGMPGASMLGLQGTHSQSSASGRGVAILNTLNQTGSAGYQALWISPYEATTGSGARYLIDAGLNSAASGGGTHTPKFTVDDAGNGYFAGNVNIGTTTAHSEALSVNGTIRSSEVVVETTGWPDYVFAKPYTLLPLSQVESYISRNQHLPGIPAAADIEKDGQKLGELNKLLMQKVEELTLYAIDAGKQNKLLKEQAAGQAQKLAAQEARLKALEAKLEALAQKAK